MKKMLSILAILLASSVVTFAAEPVDLLGTENETAGDVYGLNARILWPHQSDTWRAYTYGSATVGDKAGDLYLSHYGVEYFTDTSWSVSLEAVFGGLDGKSGMDDGHVVGGTLLLRYYIDRSHFFGRPFNTYFDAGLGLYHFEDPFPPSGTHTNFSTQVGLGIEWDLDNDASLIMGGRWHHISNASRGDNPGFDGAMLYAGFSWDF